MQAATVTRQLPNQYKHFVTAIIGNQNYDQSVGRYYRRRDRRFIEHYIAGYVTTDRKYFYDTLTLFLRPYTGNILLERV